MGELDEQSQAIGQLQEGLKALQRDHAEKSRKDEAFRAAGYEAFGTVKRIAETQTAHAAKLEQHDKRLDGHDKSRSWAKGVIAAVGVIASAVGTGAGLLIQFISGRG